MLKSGIFSNISTMKSIVLIVSCLFMFLLIPWLTISAPLRSYTNSNVRCLLCNFHRLIPSFRNKICKSYLRVDVEPEVPRPAFVYPSGYGADKYLLRKATMLSNRSCDIYTHTSVSDVLHRMESVNLIDNSSLKFLSVEGERLDPSSVRVSFGGNVDIHKRKKYFNYYDGMELPCGFANYRSPGFRVSDEDRGAMESCRGVVLISAIFGGYDKLRQPKRVRRMTAENVCFFMFVDNVTLAGLASQGIEPDESNKIGVWRIVLVEELPYEEYVMNGLIPKYLPHRLFPNCLYSIWMDAKIQLTVDPLLVLENLLVHHKADIALSRHPYNVQTMEEAIFTVRWGKWSREAVRRQMEDYCADGFQPWSPKKLPYTSDVGDTALILRKHSLPANLFSCLLFNEIQVFSPRDQLAFAYVRDMMNPKVKIHMFQVKIFNTITNEYRHSYKPNINGRESKAGDPALEREIYMSYESTTCKPYLGRMWNTS